MQQSLIDGFQDINSPRWIEIPNDVSCGMTVLEAMAYELELAGFDPRQIKAIETAFVEALINAVRHGNGDDPRRTVLIEYSIDPDGIRMAIEDEGFGFCLDEVDDPTEPDHMLRPGGRGLLMIRSMMDEVAFNGRGNRITMRHSKRVRRTAA